jgi:hypothetical protein
MLLAATSGGCGSDDETPPAEQEPAKPSATEERAAAVEEVVVERTSELTQGVAPDFAPTSADCEYVRSTPGGSDVFSCSVTDGDISLGPLDWLVPPDLSTTSPYDSGELLNEVAENIGQPLPGDGY